MRNSKVRKKQPKKLLKPLLCLLDSGSSHTWLNSKQLPPGIHGKKDDKISSQTLAGALEGVHVVNVEIKNRAARQLRLKNPVVQRVIEHVSTRQSYTKTKAFVPYMAKLSYPASSLDTNDNKIRYGSNNECQEIVFMPSQPKEKSATYFHSELRCDIA